MRKKLLTALALTATLATTSCGSSVKTKTENDKYVLFSIGDNNYYSDDLFGVESKELTLNMLTSSTGQAKAYEIVWNALVQENQPVTTTVQNSADLAYEDWIEDTVNGYVSTYSITYKQALAAALEESGCDTEKEKQAQLLLEEQKTALQKSYLKNKIDPDLSFLDGNSPLESYIENANPMIISHILISISDSNDVYEKASITSDEAQKLGTVATKLALSNNSSNKFSLLAQTYSTDGSYTYGGNLGIMDTYTSYVSEFKYGLYVAQIALHHNDVDFDYRSYGLSATQYEELFGKNGLYADFKIPTISVDQVCQGLINNSSNETTRNNLFNQYFNNTGASFLVYSNSASTTTFPKADRSVNSQGFVTDENGNPIIVVRSQYGIHFMTVNYDSALHSMKENVNYFSYTTLYAAASSEENYVKSENSIGYESLLEAQNDRQAKVKESVENYLKGHYLDIEADEKYLKAKMFLDYINNSYINFASTELKDSATSYANSILNALNGTVEAYELTMWDSYCHTYEYDRQMRKQLYK